MPPYATYIWPSGAHLQYCTFSVMNFWVHEALCDLQFMDQVLLQLIGLARQDHRVDHRSLAHTERDAVSLSSRFLSLRSSSCRLPFALQVPVILSCSCHAPVMLLSCCQSLHVILWRWPLIVERLTGSRHSAVSRTAIAQSASENAVRYVKIIDHHDT